MLQASLRAVSATRNVDVAFFSSILSSFNIPEESLSQLALASALSSLLTLASRHIFCFYQIHGHIFLAVL